MIYVLFALFFATTCIAGDIELNPIKTEDLQRIVDSVKKDVDSHLKMAYSGHTSESLSPEFSTVLGDTENGKEYRNFLNVIKESMEHHLFNLGRPSDAKNNGSTDNLKPKDSISTLFSTESVSEQSSKSSEKDNVESSSKVYEYRVGSTKGVPGVNFPDYTDIPITSFTCSEKSYFPAFYADLDTGCQAFHVCWPDRKESFLCPMGTIFNQAIRVCDYWYNSNCSLAPRYYDAKSGVEPNLSQVENESASSMIKTLLEKTNTAAPQMPNSSTNSGLPKTSDLAIPLISEFIPIKAKITIYPKTATQRLKIVSTASIGEGKKSDFRKKPGQTNSSTTKHTRIPRSLKYTKSTVGSRIGKLPFKRQMFRIYEALDRAVRDIENDESVSILFPYARIAVKGIKSFFSFAVDENQKDIGYEPGSELYEDDMEMKKLNENLHQVWKSLLILMANFKKEYNEYKYTKEIPERTSKPGPLTNLNPRFIVKPATYKRTSVRTPEMPTLFKIKRASTISSPLKLSRKDHLRIHPETKNILIKSYMKLFKRKHKSA